MRVGGLQLAVPIGVLLVMFWCQPSPAAAGAPRTKHKKSYPPQPLEGWRVSASVLPPGQGNPFASLPRLPKPHYTWPICGIAVSMAGCIKHTDRTLVDFVRVTGVLPLGLDGVLNAEEWDVSFDNRTVYEAVAICAEVKCSLGLFFSPWNQFFPGNDPTVEGDTPMPFTGGGKPRIGSENAELAFWRSRLEQVVNHLATANAARGLTGANAVSVSAVFVDSEKFGSDCPLVNCNNTQQTAIRRKHDLIYNQSKEVFPEASYDAFDRGPSPFGQRSLRARAVALSIARLTTTMCSIDACDIDRMIMLVFCLALTFVC